jgi:hypothetical protein
MAILWLQKRSSRTNRQRLQVSAVTDLCGRKSAREHPTTTLTSVTAGLRSQLWHCLQLNQQYTGEALHRQIPGRSCGQGWLSALAANCSASCSSAEAGTPSASAICHSVPTDIATSLRSMRPMAFLCSNRVSVMVAQRCSECACRRVAPYQPAYQS